MSASGTLISIGTVVGLYALLALALNIKFGYTGILDFGHVAYFLIGAYTAALLVAIPAEEQRFMEYILGLNLPTRMIEAVEGATGVYIEFVGGFGWLIAIVVAVIVAGFFGLIVALPAIRLREDYLAITLLGVAVVANRVINTETWLANGPDSLAGYPMPFEEVFPLPNSSVSAALLIALIIFTVWAIILVLGAREPIFDRHQGQRSTAAHAALAVATVGVGYWAVRRSRIRKAKANLPPVGPQVAPKHYLEVVAVAALYGVVGAIGSYVGWGEATLFVIIGLACLAAWVVALTKVFRHYSAYGRREATAGLILAIGMIVAIGPAYVLGSGEGLLAWIASIVTFALFGVYFGGLYLLNDRWEHYGLGGSYLGILGIGLLWVLAIRYFLVSLDNPIGDPAGVAFSTMENVLFLLDIEAVFEAGMGYRRFQFVLIIAMVFIGYFLMQMVVNSPYGRVLRAVRDDENVAQSLGKNAFSFKVQSMVIGSALAGLAGALGAIYYGAISHNTFHPLITFFIFMAVILGGKANNKGVMLGAAFYWLFVRATVELAGIFPGPISDRITILRNAIIGLILILILYYQPKGIWEEERFTTEVDTA